MILLPVIPERYMEITRDSKVMLHRWAKSWIWVCLRLNYKHYDMVGIA